MAWLSFAGLRYAALAAPLSSGLLFAYLGVPLAWLLGPLVGSAAISLIGSPIFAPVAGRRLGQMIVGATIGLHVTGSMIGGMIAWFPAMAATAMVSVTLAAFASAFLARLGDIDEKTAYYAMLPGGLSEMANVGMADGARPEPIALAQSLRVAIVVCLVPPAIVSLGIDGGVYESHSTLPIELWMVPVLLCISGLGIAILSALGLGNVWMTGSLVSIAVLSAFGWPNRHMLPIAFGIAQFLIGISVGARFKRDIIFRLPRIAAASALMSIVITCTLFGLAMGLAHLTGLDLASAALASSPGGLAEMASTAQILHLGIVLVTAFHVTRAILVNAFATRIYRLFSGIGLLRLGSWIARGFR